MTDLRNSQLVPETLIQPNPELRNSQLVPETLILPNPELRDSQLAIETLQPNDEAPAPSRVTETGAYSAQQDNVSYVTQAGASSAQQSDEVYVTQIGLLIIFGEALPPPECPGELAAPRIDGIAVPRPITTCPGGDGTLGPPRTGAEYEPSTADAGRDPVRPAAVKRAA